MILGLLILTAYLASGLAMAIYGAANLRNSVRTSSTSLFAHRYGKADQPILFWLGVLLSLGAIVIGLPMIVGSIAGLLGSLGALQ